MSLQQTLTTSLNEYFRPKTFEQSGKLYEHLGVKLFKDYCPNGGAKFGSMITNKSRQGLEGFVFGTKVLESIHVIALFPFTYFMLSELFGGDKESSAFLALINIFGNVYPIISQRYNRNRAERILRKKYNPIREQYR